MVEDPKGEDSMKMAIRITILAILACVLAGCGQKSATGKKVDKARAPAVEQEIDEDVPASDDEA